MMKLYPSTETGETKDVIMDDLKTVSGTEGARSYIRRPSTRDVVWDKDENYFWIRETDMNGNLLHADRYSYQPDPEPKPEDLFVTKENFNELKEEISDVKQSIQKLLSLQTAAAESNKPNSGKSNKPNDTNYQGHAKG